MSVTASTTIVPRPWRGYDDPGLPVATYLGQILSTGDATGGTNTTVFIFNNLVNPASARYYNIEQIDASVSAVVAAQDLGMFTLNFDQVGNTTLITRHWGFLLEANGVGVSPIDYQLRRPPLPLFLGQTTRLGTQQSSLTFSTPNVDTIPLIVTIQGYIWEPRSVQSQGGLRRPIDSVYGQ